MSIRPVSSTLVKGLSRCVRVYLVLFFTSALGVILTSCDGNINANGGLADPSPTPNPRADLQIPGLIQLVETDLSGSTAPSINPQLDIGAETYFQICLACHGDWGQGLTDEWRATWGEDQNCWQSKCHASNHPPWGFSLPRSVPPVLGLGSLARYRNARELHQNIALSMPWWNPGSLTDEQAWGVTAYLLHERSELSEDVLLEEGIAPIIRMHVPASQPADDRPMAVLMMVMLSIAVVALTIGKERLL